MQGCNHGMCKSFIPGFMPVHMCWFTQAWPITHPGQLAYRNSLLWVAIWCSCFETSNNHTCAYKAFNPLVPASAGFLSDLLYPEAGLMATWPLWFPIASKKNCHCPGSAHSRHSTVRANACKYSADQSQGLAIEAAYPMGQGYLAQYNLFYTFFAK